MKKFLLMCFSFGFAISLMAQDRVVTGKLTSKDDASVLPGVNIVLKGTTTGTVSDAEGNYQLSVPASGGTLMFSFIGYTTQEVVIGERKIIDLQMESDTKTLSEVVVTGAGVATDKKKLGISVESITSDKLPATPTASIDQALVGKVAGAQISSISGNPGDPVNILLRGINTVQGGTLPLIMVDGVQAGATDLNSLDLNNVERIEVVQGAASASIYGAQGAKGVIQIFTKKGRAGKMAINFSSSYAQNEFLNVGNVHKSMFHPYQVDANNNIVSQSDGVTPLQYTDYGAIEDIAYQFGGGPPVSAGTPQGTVGGSNFRYAALDPRNTNHTPYNGNLKYYDHFKQVFKTGYTTNNSLNFSGGGDKNDFSVTISDNKTLSPVLQNGTLERTNLSVNLGFELFKGFKIRSITQAIYTSNNMVPGLGGAGGFDFGRGQSIGSIGAVYGFLNTSPFFDLTRKDADGNYPLYQTADFLSVNSANPYYYKQYASGKDDKIDVLQNFEADYTINKFFELNAKYGLNYRNETARQTYANQSQNLNSNVYAPNYIGVYASENTGEIVNYQYNNTFHNLLANGYFRSDLKEDFNFSLPISVSTQVGFDYRKRIYKEYDSYGAGLGLYPPVRVTNTATQAVVRDYVEPFITYGYLVNQKINYGDYGGLTAGFRSDWSSAFGRGSTPFTFPHADVFLSLSTFWKDGKLGETLPYFKIRAAYGQAGIQPNAFDRFSTLDPGNLGNRAIYSIPTTFSSPLQNPNLKVEVSTEKEGGFDFTINALKGDWLRSINGSFTYWTRHSDNVIYTVNLPLSTGTPNQLTNAMGMGSDGFQFSLNMPVYTSNTLKWDFTTNFGHQYSKITTISGGADIILTSSAGSTSLVLTPGRAIGQVYGYKTLRSVTDTDQNGNRYVTPGNESNYAIVEGRLTDLTTYQMQFANQQVPVMQPNPDFNMAFINSLGFKDYLTFTFQFDWIKGSHLYNQTKEWMYRDGISGDFDKKVTINGTTAAYTAYRISAYYNLFGTLFGPGNNSTKDYFVEDASFVRLRNVTVGFDFAKVFKINSLKKLQIVFTGRNLWTKTKYSGYDPEVSSGTVNSSFDRGVDHSTLPNIKSYQVGLNIGF